MCADNALFVHRLSCSAIQFKDEKNREREMIIMSFNFRQECRKKKKKWRRIQRVFSCEFFEERPFLFLKRKSGISVEFIMISVASQGNASYSYSHSR